MFRSLLHQDRLSGYASAVVAECGGEPALQQWEFDVPTSEFLHNKESDMCLNVSPQTAELHV